MQSIGLKSCVGQQSFNVLSGLTMEALSKEEKDLLLIKSCDLETMQGPSNVIISLVHSFIHTWKSIS